MQWAVIYTIHQGKLISIAHYCSAEYLASFFSAGSSNNLVSHNVISHNSNDSIHDLYRRYINYNHTLYSLNAVGH